MREAALVTEAAAAVVAEVEANALAASLAAAALAALAAGAVPGKMRPATIEALHTFPTGLASSSLSSLGAVACKMRPTTIEAIHALATPLLALVFALALAALGAVAREVVATAIEALHWTSHLLAPNHELQMSTHPLRAAGTEFLSRNGTVLCVRKQPSRAN